MWIDAADIQMVLFYFNLATLLCQSWCSKLIYREICVKRSPVGNKEMSALKYGIKYWAKIDRLIASPHINTWRFNNREGLSVMSTEGGKQAEKGHAMCFHEFSLILSVICVQYSFKLFSFFLGWSRSLRGTQLSFLAKLSSTCRTTSVYISVQSSGKYS